MTMAPTPIDEQFKFLISCIRFTNNGKIDFGRVAAERKIVNKVAAAKRYERLMRAHGIYNDAASVKPTASQTTKNDRRDPATRPKSNKKREVEDFIKQNSPTDVKKEEASRQLSLGNVDHVVDEMEDYTDIEQQLEA